MTAMGNKVMPTARVSLPSNKMDESRNVTTRIPPRDPPSHREQRPVAPFQENTDRSI
jgi:hypothetical protein